MLTIFPSPCRWAFASGFRWPWRSSTTRRCLILDEPTSGVDPVARDEFWELLIDLSRQKQVTIFISTHFMNEAMRCDRISLMHAGTVLACDKPAAARGRSRGGGLEEAFIAYIAEAAGEAKQGTARPRAVEGAVGHPPYPAPRASTPVSSSP